ncbi:ParB/RepB/Spo0J family partition protein [uncultured Erythrobacter sp.]|uniref:ParB/RepB/Spo0J family partition protein n=1 Tax=uncultured Erythrobacter sp. TaxID=263913 RepID=UPI002628B974|nr:ParB/RepB/Spo0J family partition protein [uncultured Erythrobacter sp.]
MTINTVKLSQLALSKLNVRNVKPTQIETLAEDIAAHGIIQSLGVYEEDGIYLVFAGGRRFSALTHLEREGTIDGDYEVPIIVRSKAEAVELSAAENLQREDMHTADRIKAFGALHGEGNTQSEIAARFGYSEGHVARLLKLSSLSPSLLQAMAKDELSLESAKELVLASNQKTQREVFAQCGNSPYQIRRMIGEGKVSTTDRLFVFVGREAYEAEGGTITIDLFSQGDEGFADDGGLVETLASRKLDEVAEGLKEQGWHTVRPCLEQPDDYYNLRSIYAEERDLTTEEDEELAKLEDQLEAAEASENEDQWDELDAKRKAILDGAKSWTEDQRQIGGVIVTVSYQGELELRHYQAVKVNDKSGKPETPPEFAAKLEQEMHSLRSLALQDALAANPDLALTFLLDTLAGKVLHSEFATASAVGVEARIARFAISDDLHHETIGTTAETIADQYAELEREDRFETIAAMSSEDKLALLAKCVAVTATFDACYRGAFESAMQSADVDMSKVWRVTVPFCDRLTKKQMLTIMEEECGAEAVANCKNLKKGDLSTELAERLPQGWLPKPMRGVTPSPQADDEETSQAA